MTICGNAVRLPDGVSKVVRDGPIGYSWVASASITSVATARNRAYRLASFAVVVVGGRTLMQALGVSIYACAL